MGGSGNIYIYIYIYIWPRAKNMPAGSITKRAAPASVTTDGQHAHVGHLDFGCVGGGVRALLPTYNLRTIYHFGIILGPFWDHLGTILGPSWDHFGTILGQSWDHFGRNKLLCCHTPASVRRYFWHGAICMFVSIYCLFIILYDIIL